MQGTKPTFRGNHSDEKHSEVGYEIPTGNTEGNRIHTCCPRLVDGFLSEHFGIKTEEENVGLKDCDNIQVTSDRTNVYKHICVYVVNQYLYTYNFLFS